MKTHEAASTQQAITTEDVRISVDDFKKRLASGESVTVLDSRGDEAWRGSTVKIRGARRVPATDGPISATWPKNQLTVAYCT